MEHSPVAPAFFSSKHREIDRLRTRLTWLRMRGLRRKFGFLLAVVIWPFWASYLAARLVTTRGRDLKLQYGIPLYRQYLHQLTLALCHNRPPHIYYMYGLHDSCKRRNACDYITPQEFRGFVDISLQAAAEELFRNKHRFEIECKLNALPTTTTLLRLCGGSAVTLSGETVSSLPTEDLFVKLQSGLGGQGAAVWRWENNYFRGFDGLRVDAEVLFADLRAMSMKKPLLIQSLLSNHSDISRYLGVTALATVRMFTGRSKRGEASLLFALFKVPRLHSIVDNLGSGGIGCPIDLDTGELMAGYTKGSADPYTNHPDTGAIFAGYRLPGWNDAVELAYRAHRAFPGLAFAGWDIALTDEGPVIVEGNTFPSVESMQQAYGPLLQSKLFLGLCLEQSGGSSQSSEEKA